jgi:hypothetical protein
VYDASVGWFRSFAASDASGAITHEMLLVEHETGFVGEVAKWRVETLVDLHGSGPQLGEAERTLPAGVTDIWMRYRIVCFQDLGGYLVWLRPGDLLRAAEGHLGQGPCDRDITFEDVVSATPGEGTWRVTYAWGEDETKPVYSLTVLLRTLEWDVPTARTVDPNL